MSLGSGLGSVIGGLINNGRSLPTVDLSALFDSIANAGASQRSMINQLPESMKPLYDQYIASLGKAGTNLQTSTNQIGQDLMSGTKALYDPNSAAVQATLAALKQQDYSTLPGTLTNLRAQLAGTGGLSTGGAGRALTSAVMAPAAQFSQQAANTEANQLNLQQTNVQAALNKIAQLDDQTAQSLFGMSKEQAANILQYGRSDLQTQLSQLINQSVNETNQKLSVEGLQAQNAYQNAVTRNQQQAAVVNGLANTAGSMIDEAAPSGSQVMSYWSQFMGGPGQQPQQAFPQSTDNTSSNALVNQPNNGSYGAGKTIMPAALSLL